MANPINKYHFITLDTKHSPRVALQNIVAGETGNRIWVTLTNGGTKVNLAEKEDSAFIYRVCLRVDSALGTRRQDSAMENSGITLIDDDTSGDYGKCNIRLSKDSFTAGLNRCRLEIYSKTWQTNDTLICSAEFQFTAAGNPTGENAGNVYPSLIKLENELAALKSETIAAKEAALAAAESAEYEAGQASTEATLAGQKAALADAAATAANEAASAAASATNDAVFVTAQAASARDSATAAASSANTAASSANGAASAANEAASAANTAAAAALAAAKRNFYIVNYTETTWDDDDYITTTTDSYETLQEIAADALFASYVTLPTGERVAAYEYYRESDIVYLRSEVVNGQYVTAFIDNSSDVDNIGFKLRHSVPVRYIDASLPLADDYEQFITDIDNGVFKPIVVLNNIMSTQYERVTGSSTHDIAFKAYAYKEDTVGGETVRAFGYYNIILNKQNYRWYATFVTLLTLDS